MKTPILDQKCIDTSYLLLQGFDPECRSGELMISAGDTPELRAEKEKRIHAYRTECARFQQLSQNRVQQIHEYYKNNIEHALLDFPHNSIPETHIPFLSLDTYESLLVSLYEKNKDQINTLVGIHYSDSDAIANDPYGIYKRKINSLRTRFRIEYSNSSTPYPRIILGWDTSNPQVLRIDKNGMIVSSESIR